jgi:hypothetical protein
VCAFPGLDYLSIGSGNDELDVYADFTFISSPPSFNFDILFNRLTPWVNPMGIRCAARAGQKLRAD